MTSVQSSVYYDSWSVAQPRYAEDVYNDVYNDVCNDVCNDVYSDVYTVATANYMLFGRWLVSDPTCEYQPEDGDADNGGDVTPEGSPSPPPSPKQGQGNGQGNGQGQGQGQQARLARLFARFADAERTPSPEPEAVPSPKN